MVTYVVETTYLDASGAAVDSEKVSVEGIVKCREKSANTRVSLPYAVDTDTCCFSIREPSAAPASTPLRRFIPYMLPASLCSAAEETRRGTTCLQSPISEF